MDVHMEDIQSILLELTRLEESFKEFCESVDQELLIKDQLTEALWIQVEASRKSEQEVKKKLRKCHQDMAVMSSRSKLKEKLHKKTLLHLKLRSNYAKPAHNPSELHLQADFDERLALQKAKSDMALKKQADVYERELENLKKQLCERKEEKQQLQKEAAKSKERADQAQRTGRSRSWPDLTVATDWCREKEAHALTALKVGELMVINKHLQDKITEQQSKLEDALVELRNSKVADKLKAGELDCVSLKTKVKELETCQRHFTEDTIDNNVQMDENVQHQLNCLQKTLDNDSELRNTREQLQEATEHLEQTKSSFLQLVNEKILEVHQLKTELRGTHLRLHKISRPAPQKIKSWINKKVLHTAQTVQNAEEEQPELYPDDWQPLGPVHDAASPASCADDTSQACLPPDDSGTPVMQFEDDKMASGDI